MTQAKAVGSKVVAIVVCYNPKIAPLKIALTATLQQVDQLLIVDNGSKNLAKIELTLSELKAQLGPESKAESTLELLAQESNLGLGAAHNLGIARARELEADWVLLLDQDSVPLQNMVSQLLVAAEAKRQQLPLSAVGATYLNADNGSESFFVRFGLLKFKRQYCGARDTHGCVEADFLISSGSLISLSAIDEIGGMDEALFIDHIDTEWFLRARAIGFRAYGVCDAMMQHGLGEQTHRLNLGRQRNVPQHKPFRYYYIFRNSILLYRRGNISRLWKWNDFQRLGMIFIMFTLFKGPRLTNLKMMLRGIADGLRGRSGPITLEV